MKPSTGILLCTILLLSTLALLAQPGPRGGGPGGPPPGPRLGGDMAKIFGEHPAFSANLEVESQDGPGQTVTVPGKIAYLNGKSRFEMNLSETKGGPMPPGAAEQMKQMGMDQMVMISRPDKKLSYVVYPGLKAYAEVPLEDPHASKPEADFQMEATEMGKEKVKGRDCAKAKVVVTDKEGKKHESLVWRDPELKKFPVKIETKDKGKTTVMQFDAVKLDKPDAAQFDPPSDFTKYQNVMALMQQEMMKRMGGGAGFPPPGR